jgi:hypothetical protein
MQIKRLKIKPIIPIVLLIMMALFCQPSPVGGASIVSTDKDIYNYSETIKINFSNAPGNEGDWICIVPVGSPDTEAGDYKYMPKGLMQGFLTFDPPSAPGKYEARAYYNYSRNGYVVSGRYAFSVVSSPEGEAAMAQRMERKIDPNNPLEAKLPPGQGLVYIFREAYYSSATSWFSGSFEVPIMANGKPLVTMRHSSYFLFSVPAGNVAFTANSLLNNNRGNNGEIMSLQECESTIKVKPGYVYYLKLRLVPTPFWAVFLDRVSYQEGANIIESNKLTLLK